MAPQGKVQRRDVAVSHKQFRMGLRRRVIKVRQQAQAAIPAPRSHKHFYVVPPQKSVQFVEPLGVGSGQVSRFREGGSPRFHPIAPPFQLHDPCPKPGLTGRCAGRRDDADRISRFEGKGFHGVQ